MGTGTCSAPLASSPERGGPGVGLAERDGRPPMGKAKALKSEREFAAWLGSVPRQTGIDGRVRLLGISKRGDKYLLALLIHGAHSVSRTSPAWLTELVKRRPKNAAFVALANRWRVRAWLWHMSVRTS